MTDFYFKLSGEQNADLDTSLEYAKEKIQKADTLTMIDAQTDNGKSDLIPYFQNTIIDIFVRHNIDYQNKKLAFDHYIFITIGDNKNVNNVSSY